MFNPRVPGVLPVPKNGLVHNRSAGVVAYTRKGRPIFAIAGGADVDETIESLTAARVAAIEKGQEVLAEIGDAPPSDEQAARLEAASAELKSADEQLASVGRVAQAKTEFEQAAESARAASRVPVFGRSREDAKVEAPQARLSPGEELATSEDFKEWASRSGSDNFRSEGVITGMLQAVLNPARSLITGLSDTSAGAFIEPLQRGLLEPGLVRPLRIVDLLTVLPVSTDAIEYVRENSRAQAAAPVAEATALTGTSGLKAEGNIDWVKVSEVVATIAVWVATTRNAAKDAPQLMALVNEYLRSDLLIELEDQVLTGDGQGENLLGILSTPGVEDVGAPGQDESAFDTIRQAYASIVVDAKTRPTAIVFHPADSAKIDLLKVNDEVNNFVGMGPFSAAQPPLWGVARVESEAMDEGTWLLGDFKRGVLFDREQTTITMGTVDNDFIRNIMRVLAELRAGFGVLRPAAFKYGDIS